MVIQLFVVNSSEIIIVNTITKYKYLKQKLSSVCECPSLDENNLKSVSLVPHQYKPQRAKQSLQTRHLYRYMSYESNPYRYIPVI